MRYALIIYSVIWIGLWIKAILLSYKKFNDRNSGSYSTEDGGNDLKEQIDLALRLIRIFVLGFLLFTAVFTIQTFIQLG